MQRLYYLCRPSRAPRTFDLASAIHRTVLGQVRERGFAVIPDYLDEAYCARCRAEIDTMFAAHDRHVHKREDWRIFGAEHLSPAVAQFHDPEFITLADAYTGHVNAMPFTLAARIAATGSQTAGGGGWHRDGFMPELKTMLYLNDVDTENGPFEIVEGSHRREVVIADMKVAGLKFLPNRIGAEVDALIRLRPERSMVVTAKAGTLIVFDTSTIHRGTPVRSGVRYALTNYIIDQRQVSEETLMHYAPLFRGPNDVVQRTTPSSLQQDRYRHVTR